MQGCEAVGWVGDSRLQSLTVGCAITTSRIGGGNAAERKRKNNRDDLDERLSLFFSWQPEKIDEPTIAMISSSMFFGLSYPRLFSNWCKCGVIKFLLFGYLSFVKFVRFYYLRIYAHFLFT